MAIISGSSNDNTTASQYAVIVAVNLHVFLRNDMFLVVFVHVNDNSACLISTVINEQRVFANCTDKGKINRHEVDWLNLSPRIAEKFKRKIVV